MSIFNIPKSLLEAVNGIILNEHEMTRREVKKVNDQYSPEISQHKLVAQKISGHAFPEDKDRVVVPLENGMTNVQQDVESHIHSHGYHSTEYHNGVTMDTHGRKVSIGRALTKTKAPQNLIDRYATHQQSVGKNPESENLQVVISKHPHDVIGMSQGTEWGLRGNEGPIGHEHAQQSCMKFDTPQFKQHMSKELSNGTHVAWLTHKGDDEAKEPLARITLRPYKESTGETGGTMHLRIHEDDAHKLYGSEFPLEHMHKDIQEMISDHSSPDLKASFTHKDDHGNYNYIVTGSKTPEHDAHALHDIFQSTPPAVVHAYYKPPEKHYDQVLMWIHDKHPTMKNAREFHEDMKHEGDMFENKHDVFSHYMTMRYDPEYAEDAHIRQFSHINYHPEFSRGEHHAFMVNFSRENPIAESELKQFKNSINAAEPDKMHPITMLPHREAPSLTPAGDEAKTILVPGKKVYGQYSDAFKNTVRKWAETATPYESGKTYHLASGVYSDGDPHTIIG